MARMTTNDVAPMKHWRQLTRDLYIIYEYNGETMYVFVKCGEVGIKFILYIIVY
jgi:hypothetical protein